MFAKRLFDIVFSLTVLFLAAPLLLLIACLIKLSSEGSIFFFDERIGQKGASFRCIKFRTMHRDARLRLQTILENNQALHHEWLTYQKLQKDPRITPVGAFLRKTSLDEIPQFINVLTGSMSVVGPRPVTRLELEERFHDKAEKVLSVKPGITGLWQTSGRSNISYEERVLLETSYVDKRNFWLDMKIIIKTVPAMTRGSC